MKRLPWRTIAAVAPAAAILLIALWELWATFAVARGVAGDHDWAAAAAEVRAGRRPGDLIVFAPRWVDPVGRHELGDLIPIEVAGRMDAARFARVWEVSVREASAPEVRGARRVSSRWHGGVRVRLYEQTPVRVKTDFVASFAAAQGGGATAILEEVGFQPHRCVRAEPPVGGSLRVVWPSAELGRSIVGYVGLADVFTRRDIRAPGTLELLVGGQRAARVTVGVDDGWIRFEAPTTPGRAEVAFVASADAPRRLICFAAEARE